MVGVDDEGKINTVYSKIRALHAAQQGFNIGRPRLGNAT